jgi:hypothetical protein
MALPITANAVHVVTPMSCRAELPSYLMSAKAIAPRPAWLRRLIVVLWCRSMRGEIKSMKDVLSEIGTN